MADDDAPTAADQTPDEPPKEDPGNYEIELVQGTFMGTFTLRDKRTGKIRRMVNGDPWGIAVDVCDFDGEQWYDEYLDYTLTKAVGEIATPAEPNRASRRASTRGVGARQAAGPTRPRRRT